MSPELRNKTHGTSKQLKNNEEYKNTSLLKKTIFIRKHLAGAGSPLILFSVQDNPVVTLDDWQQSRTWRYFTETTAKCTSVVHCMEQLHTKIHTFLRNMQKYLTELPQISHPHSEEVACWVHLTGTSKMVTYGEVWEVYLRLLFAHSLLFYCSTQVTTAAITLICGSNFNSGKTPCFNDQKGFCGDGCSFNLELLEISTLGSNFIRLVWSCCCLCKD